MDQSSSGSPLPLSEDGPVFPWFPLASLWRWTNHPPVPPCLSLKMVFSSAASSNQPFDGLMLSSDYSGSLTHCCCSNRIFSLLDKYNWIYLIVLARVLLVDGGDVDQTHNVPAEGQTPAANGLACPCLQSILFCLHLSSGSKNSS